MSRFIFPTRAGCRCHHPRCAWRKGLARLQDTKPTPPKTAERPIPTWNQWEALQDGAI